MSEWKNEWMNEQITSPDWKHYVCWRGSCESWTWQSSRWHQRERTWAHELGTQSCRSVITPHTWLTIHQLKLLTLDTRLTNIEPPALRRRAATDKLITQAECHRDWPLYDDVFHPTPLRLESRKPLWRDLQSIDVTSRWREDWQSATVVNSTLVVDPAIQLPGFDLHRRQWSLLNRFRTGQGHCNACGIVTPPIIS